LSEIANPIQDICLRH